MYNVHACYRFQRETNFSITNLVTGDISGNSRRNHTEIETNSEHLEILHFILIFFLVADES